MTDLLHTLPDFPTKSYTHLLPSLEKHLITTTDLLTLDALEIAKRAQLPVLDLRRLANHVIAALQEDLGLRANGPVETTPAVRPETKTKDRLQKTGRDIADQWSTISTLDNDLDAALGGGIPTGYITEITGESGAGKTQLLLVLLLSAQLPPPHGLSRPTLYISTEHPLPTTRLAQLLHTHPLLSNPSLESNPSLAGILTLQTPDLESQDHILAYQLPVALARHNVGLVVLDSVAANYRAEYGHSGGGGRGGGKAMARRGAELVRLGALLRGMARRYDCAVVVANQVADRFAPVNAMAMAMARRTVPAFSSSPCPRAMRMPVSSDTTPTSSSAASKVSQTIKQLRREGAGSRGAGEVDGLLALDHQQRFFTGWGDLLPAEMTTGGLKTPSLGLVWSQQIACRVAVVKEGVWGYGGVGDGGHGEGGGSVGGGGGGGGNGVGGLESAEWSVRRWRRWMRVVFAGWVGPSGEGEGKGVEFEVWGGGVRAVKGGGGV